ncbi:MAG: glycosyltransferase [Pseudomonadota bacterium]
MRIVFATSLVPTLPTDSGFEIANRAIVECLIRLGHDVQIIGFQWPERETQFPDQTHTLAELDVKTDNASGKQKLVWLAQAVRSNTTFAAAKLQVLQHGAFGKALDALKPFDALIVNGIPIAGAFEEALSRYPFIYVAHNQEALAAEHAAENAAGMVEKLMYQRETRQLAKLEARLAKTAKSVLAFTSDDADAMTKLGARASHHLPLVTPPTGEIQDRAGARPIAFDAGMIGTWTWTQNRIGLEWFLQSVMPLMPEHTRIAVAGSLPSVFPQRDKRVTLLGRVLDAKAFIRSCRVSILCARAGTGIQLKTLETFELGLPAVATASSLRGIGEPLPDNVIEADTAEAFAAALKQHIVDVRTGSARDMDGTAFRAHQMSRMDAVMADALNVFTKSMSA